VLIARLRGRGPATKPIVLLNHMDVVPADPARWSFPPLSGEIRDGVIYGRGALDMKGLGVAMLMAMRLLAERNELPQHDLVFLAVPDEEVGGTQGAAWLAQNRPDLFEVEAVWDEGGIGSTDLLPAPALMISIDGEAGAVGEAVDRGTGRPRIEAAARRGAAPTRRGADPRAGQSAGAAPHANRARGLQPRRSERERHGGVGAAPS
jgi:acetylornithine deacetylase/succinyl-diaminopimelate desuccinylase-like protein